MAKKVSIYVGYFGKKMCQNGLSKVAQTDNTGGAHHIVFQPCPFIALMDPCLPVFQLREMASSGSGVLFPEPTENN